MVDVVNPRGFDHETWYATRIRRRLLERNKNFLVAFVGETGSGKSWSALRLSSLVDPTFDVSRVFFTPEEFVEAINKSYPSGTALVWDEAGISFGSRDWQSRMNRIVSAVLQSFRYKNYLTCFTLPSQIMMDVHGRLLFHSIIECNGADLDNKIVRGRPFLVSHGRDGKQYEQFPRIYFRGHGTVRMVNIHFRRPPEELTSAYEDRREDYLRGYYAKLLEEVRPKEEVDDGWNLKALRALTEPCEKCGHRRTQMEIGAVLGHGREWVNRELARGRVRVTPTTEAAPHNG